MKSVPTTLQAARLPGFQVSVQCSLVLLTRRVVGVVDCSSAAARSPVCLMLDQVALALSHEFDGLVKAADVRFNWLQTRRLHPGHRSPQET